VTARSEFGTETLDLLSDVAASFARRDGDRVRAARGSVDRDMWRRFGDNGWLGILVDTDLGLDAVVIVARALGRGAFHEPFVAGGVLAPLLVADEPELLAAVLSGEQLVGVGWQPVRVDGGRLTGTSRFVGLAGADAYVVAGDDGGLYLVNQEASPPDSLADGTRSAVLEFDGAPARRLAPADLDAALDIARVAVAAELVGLADGALEMTLEFLRQRKQFGVPIGSFQALQHRAVDTWIQRELAGAALDAAVAVFLDPDSTPRARAAAASSAKARAAIAGPLVGKAALQLHGAIGYTDEYDVGLYLNRALTLAPWLGNAAEHTRRYAELTA
jgi:alkylation response protein AidB-like acyl-CoA dehydrogenase